MTIALLALSACSQDRTQTSRVTAAPSNQIVRAIDWTGHGVWLKADLHTHTRFSDGRHTVDDVVAMAAKHGCDVVAISDHTDAELSAATPEYLDAILRSRKRTPSVVVLTAVEWNVPPGKGREHATVLFPTAMETRDALATFKQRFDDFDKRGDNVELAQQALQWLVADKTVTPSPLVIINHPNRKPDSPSAPRLTFEGLARAAPIPIAFEGAPGHQRGVPLGAYDGAIKPIDRWDPLVAEVGGEWDRWLGAGLDVWAAVAGSDFHEETGDFWPCEFAETWIYAPERSVDGVIRALDAGSFFAGHGHIVREVELTARLAGLPRAVTVGETVRAEVGTLATVALRMIVPERDYANRDNRIDSVELIGVSSQGTSILFKGPPAAPDAFSVQMPVPQGGIVLRARGRHRVTDGPSLMFYTNPLRIVTPER